MDLKAFRTGVPLGLCLIAWLGMTGDSRPIARLVSYDALPPETEECALPEPAAPPLSLAAAELPLRNILMQARAAAEVPFTANDASQRKPERMIRDPYAAYSAVAVDPNHDEVVMTDENLFNIWVYDRKFGPAANDRPELRRLIGGLNTKIEFQCGLYIDPGNGDIYAVNNDTIDTLVIFSRKAVGDVKPDRELHTPHGTFGIAVDEEKQELFLTVQHDNAIVVYNKSAKGTEAPLRVVQGDHTGLADPHGMALDTKRSLLWVTNHGSSHSVHENPNRRRPGSPGFPLDRDDAVPGSGKMGPPSITVYAKDAKGDARPLRTIQGPRTRMNWPTGIAIDEDRNEIYVANDGGNSVLVFDGMASGDAAPKRVINGARSLVSNPTGIFFDKKNHELWVTNFGNHTSGAYSPDANGDAAPLRVIRSAGPEQPVPGLGNPHPIAYDTRRQQVLVPNWVAHPQIAVFARLAENGAKPVRKVEGQASLLGRTMHGIAYDAIHDEFSVPQQFGQAILTYRGAANGEEPPIRVIEGPHTRLDAPEHLDVDPVHNEIFMPTRSGEVLVFPRDGKGIDNKNDVAPIRVLGGPNTMITGDAPIAVDPVNNLLFVGGTAGRGQTRLLIFNRTDSGDVKPKAVIGGPNSHLYAFGGPMAVYPQKGEILVSVRGPGPFAELASEEAFVGVWKITDNGDVAPQWTIGGPHGILRMPRGIALDVKNKNMLVSDKRLNAVLTFHFPEVF